MDFHEYTKPKLGFMGASIPHSRCRELDVSTQVYVAEKIEVIVDAVLDIIQ